MDLVVTRVKALAVAAVLGMSGVAQAAVHEVGSLTGAGVKSFLVGAGSFSDQLSFTIGAGESAVATFFDVPAAGPFGVTGVSFALFGLGGKIDAAGSSWTLGSGSYRLDVSGTGSAYGGAYGLSYSVAAVPEPESYAMFLAGLGIMGAVARRRSKA